MLSKLVFDYRRIILYFVISISISSVNCHFIGIRSITFHNSIDMDELQDRLNMQDETINKLNESASIAGLEDRIKLLSKTNTESQRELDKMKKAIEKGDKQQDTVVQELLNKVNKLTNDLDEFIPLNNEYALLRCIEDIVNNRFDDAEKILNQIKSINQSNFDFIVKKVYAYKPANFDLLDAFARHLSNIEYSLRVYKSLEFVTRTSKNNELNIIKLAQGVKDKVMPKIDNMPFQNEARLFFDDVKNLVKEACRLLLVIAMWDENFNNEFIHVISDHVWHLDGQLFRDLIDVVIEEAIAIKVKLETILKNLHTQSYIEQKMAGYVSVAPYLYLTGTTRWTLFGYYLQQVKKSPKYDQANSEAKNIFENEMKKIPFWLQNVAFWPKCCIRDAAYSRYLYAATDGFNFDRWRRRVFLWMPGGTGSGQFHFNFEIDKDGIVFIKNLQYNEYMYSSAYEHSWSDSSTLVFTWIDKVKVSNGRWNLIHVNDYTVVIEYNGLNLGGSANRYDDDRHYVVTQSQTSDADLWYIERC